MLVVKWQSNRCQRGMKTGPSQERAQRTEEEGGDEER